MNHFDQFYCDLGETVPTLQTLSTCAVENIIRKKTSEEKDPICRSLLSLTEEQQETAEKVAGWVELLPPGVVSEIFSRLINYDGENGRKMTPMDVWVFIHPGFKQVEKRRMSLSLTITNTVMFAKKREFLPPTPQHSQGSLGLSLQVGIFGASQHLRSGPPLCGE